MGKKYGYQVPPVDYRYSQQQYQLQQYQPKKRQETVNFGFTVTKPGAFIMTGDGRMYTLREYFWKKYVWDWIKWGLVMGGCFAYIYFNTFRLNKAAQVAELVIAGLIYLILGVYSVIVAKRQLDKIKRTQGAGEYDKADGNNLFEDTRNPWK